MRKKTEESKINSENPFIFISRIVILVSEFADSKQKLKIGNKSDTAEIV